ANHPEEFADRRAILDQLDEQSIVLTRVEKSELDLSDRAPLQRLDTLRRERLEVVADRARHHAEMLQAAALETGELVVETGPRIVLLHELDLHVAPLRERGRL